MNQSNNIIHWHDNNPQHFPLTEKATTTLLFGGLTNMHDQLLEVALQGQGFKAKALAVPDNASLQLGKEFGNRGQCNPTYFTVGNLLKYLIHLRDKEGLSTDEISANYLFVTAAACGPCRFGSYATEYRKVLRDAGFENFRILTFQQNSVTQSATPSALNFTPRFFLTITKVVIAADVFNLLGYRIRPYETTKGETNRVLKECQNLLSDALLKQQSISKSLKACRKLFQSIEVDRLQAKPKVSIIGEFWAMTTEGEGNYRLQQFLESEGAECDIQPITNWLLYLLWGAEQKSHDQPGWASRLQRSKIRAVKWLLQKIFQRYASAVGLRDYQLPDMHALATISTPYYYPQLRGGEGHMEVGKLIDTTKKKKAHLVLSVKPFGCMPSSGVSDGVQSLVTAHYPEANFCAVETSGDSEANVYSRIQMSLFKARKAAEKEMQGELDKRSSSHNLPAQKDPLYWPKPGVACTAANIVRDGG